MDCRKRRNTCVNNTVCKSPRIRTRRYKLTSWRQNGTRCNIWCRNVITRCKKKRVSNNRTRSCDNCLRKKPTQWVRGSSDNTIKSRRSPWTCKDSNNSWPSCARSSRVWLNSSRKSTSWRISTRKFRKPWSSRIDTRPTRWRPSVSDGNNSVWQSPETSTKSRTR